MSSPILRQTNLVAHIVQFSQFLRKNGFEIGPNEQFEIFNTYQAQIPNSFEEQQQLLKAICVKNRRQFQAFDQLYEKYWSELSTAENSKKKEAKKSNPKKNKAPSLKELKSWLYAGRIDDEEEIASYSAIEALGKKDFSSFDAGDQRELREIIKILAKKLAKRKGRRFVPAKENQLLDLKNTVRNSLKKGGSIEQFKFKKRQKNKPNLILICDVSKSMELYSRFLIEFMYNFQQTVFSLKTFVFSTRLLSLTRILRENNYESVLNNLSEQVPYWSGGTRIGASLDEFKIKYGSYLLNKKAVVIILSDGWDTGELDILESAIQYISKRSDQLIWLNPLASHPNFTPSTKGMEICLPYIDFFSSAHNIESLKNVVQHIKTR